jgi:hypothetical protein
LAPEGATTSLPNWADLVALAELLGDAAAPRGPARQLLNDMHEAPEIAVESYRRWRELRGKEDAARLTQIDERLKALGVADPAVARLPLGPQGSPWPDALLVAELQRKALDAQSR